MTPTMLAIALRAFAVPVDAKQPKPRTRHAQPSVTPFHWPPVLVFDVETTTDATQRLLFGSYRFCTWRADGLLECTEEGLCFAEDLKDRDPKGWATIRTYVRGRRADVGRGGSPKLRCYSRRQFVDRFLKAVLEANALLVGFNLPFDLTRLVVNVGAARHPVFYGGFTMPLGEWTDPRTGVVKPNAYRPRLFLKLLDSKRAFMGLGGIKGAAPKNLFRGWPCLDLRTLTFALTGEGMSLRQAGLHFDARHVKEERPDHGVITPDYLDYSRHDVRATAALLERLRVEYDRHPIPLVPTSAFSPASIGKGYLTAMGIAPPSQQFPDVPPTLHGAAMTAYYGGRAEARIRKVTVPVAPVDFLSMYPTVNALMGTWALLTAERLRVEDVTEQVRIMLQGVCPARVLTPAFWRDLPWLALIQPQGDLFPVRARYAAAQTYGIGVNHVTAEGSLWVAGPDVVASVLLTGQVPRILRAVRLVPEGQQAGLRPVRLRGGSAIDPRHEDFFRCVIEERKRRQQEASSPRERRGLALKVLANSTGYGIFAELNPQDVPKEPQPFVWVYGNGAPFQTSTPVPENLGVYCFPPFAALTTAAARLMLALLERLVRDRGGTYACCDTDSMAIVATADGGLVPCPGGPEQLDDGTPAVRALTYEQVEEVRELFTALSPYDPETVPGSILEAEHLYQAADGTRLPVYALVLSAKRYALFTVRPDGSPELRKVSEHGLGHLLNPVGEKAFVELGGDRVPCWIVELWERLVRGALGLPAPEPAWFGQLALSRVTVTTPHFAGSFWGVNRGRSYADQVKPMNFVLCAHIPRFGHPVGVDPKQFQLVAPYEGDPTKWRTLPWFDKYSGTAWPITTEDPAPTDHARVVTYRDVAEAYAKHVEAKSAGPDGTPCGSDTQGLLQRRHIQVSGLCYIGKESNRWEDVLHGLVHRLDEVQVQYPNPDDALWETVVVPLLQQLKAQDLARWARCGLRTIKYLRNGHTRPSPKVRQKILRALERWARRTQQWRRATPEDRERANAFLRAVAPDE